MKSQISAHKVIKTSFLVDLSDIVLSLSVALITGSAVMFTQAMEGASDLLASGLLFIGQKNSQKNNDKNHPFGYGREIYFWTMISALVTFTFTAVLSFILGYHRYQNPQPVRNIMLAFWILVITFVTNAYSFSLSFRRLLGGRKLVKIIQIFYRSNLIETKTTLILDLMGTLASLLGLVALLIYQLTGDFRFDGLGAMLIGGVLAVLALSIVAEVKDLLIGISASPETEKLIRESTMEISTVNKILDLRTMLIGTDKILVNMEVNLKDSLTTDELEALIDKIKAKIKKEVPGVSHIQIELESPDQP